MIKYFIITFWILCAFSGFSQENNTSKSETVGFAIIENPPIFPGCENIEKKLQKRCLQNQIVKHVSKNFNTKLANEVGLEPGKTKLYVNFEIASDGTIKNAKARGEHKALEEEGIRVIYSLPKMTPGHHEGNAVDVKYTLPVVLMVGKKMEDDITNKVNIQYIKDNIKKVIEKGSSNLTNETVYEKIRKLGYKPKDEVKVFTQFSVDNDGFVKNIKARGPHKIFENEAIKILKQLPKIELAGKNNVGISNEFNLPIIIVIEKPKKKK
ncbi:energy transducer TonB [Aureibaculum conchae]|uniref:energy transducer TonB n=1 Tax=Aureibaculum sp. 2308TA14-22 TaxID=3108392 RepID=UPI0033991F4E